MTQQQQPNNDLPTWAQTLFDATMEGFAGRLQAAEIGCYRRKLKVDPTLRFLIAYPQPTDSGAHLSKQSLCDDFRHEAVVSAMDSVEDQYRPSIGGGDRQWVKGQIGGKNVAFVLVREPMDGRDEKQLLRRIAFHNDLNGEVRYARQQLSPLDRAVVDSCAPNSSDLTFQRNCTIIKRLVEGSAPEQLQEVEQRSNVGGIARSFISSGLRGLREGPGYLATFGHPDWPGCYETYEVGGVVMLPLHVMRCHGRIIDENSDRARAAFRNALQAGVEKPVVLLLDVSDERARQLASRLEISEEKTVREKLAPVGEPKRRRSLVLVHAIPRDAARYWLAHDTNHVHSAVFSFDSDRAFVLFVIRSGIVAPVLVADDADAIPQLYREGMPRRWRSIV